MQRHRQQMVDRAPFALAHQRTPGKDHGQHGYVVDNLHYTAEPRADQVLIELNADWQPCGGERLCSTVSNELRNLVRNDVLDVADANAGLLHGGRVNVDLKRRPPSTHHIALKVLRNVQHETGPAAIHLRIDLVNGDEAGRLEYRWEECAANALGKLRRIFIDSCDRGIGELGARAFGWPIDAEGKCVDDQQKHDCVVTQTAQFFDAEMEDVLKSFHLRSPVS